MTEAELGEVDLVNTTKAIIELGELAMVFGRIDRTCVAHPDGTPESDSDHTVMLAWIAPALAEIVNRRAGYERYPVSEVTQFAVVHDAAEVYAGDTPTLRITAAELAAKASREYAASVQLYGQFAERLPWFARMVRRYEEQQDQSARFVRSVDKIMPKVVHVLNAAQDLVRAGMTKEDFQELYERQRVQIVLWCPEPILLQLYDELCGEVGRLYPKAAVEPVQHSMVVQGGRVRLRNHNVECWTACPLEVVFNEWLAWNTLPLNDGEYPVDIDANGSLVFDGKQE